MRGGILANVQVVRAAAAMLVVLVHASDLLPEVPTGGLGHAGVDLFFVISGFVMVEATRGRSMTPARFFQRRLIRVAPLYWLMTLVVFALAVAAPSLLKSTVADPVALAKSLAFIPYAKGSGLTEPMLFVGWTLNYEMFFYLLFATGLMFGGAQVVAIALVGLCLARPLASGPVGLFYTDPIILEFGYGMAVAAIYARLSPSRAVAACVLGLGILTLLLAPQLHLHRALRFGIPAAAIVLGSVWLEKAGAPCRSWAILAVGETSYALYLSHPFVAQLAVHVSVGWPLPARITLFIVTIAAMISLAALLDIMLERPVRQWITARVAWPRVARPEIA